MTGWNIRGACVAGIGLAAALWLCPAGATAQEPPPPAQGQANPGLQRPTLPPRPLAQADTPGEVQRLFDAYTVMQAQQVLGLSDEKFGAFLPRLRGLQQTRRKHDQARQQLVGRLGRLANVEPADETQLSEALKALADLDDQHAAGLRQAYAALDETLTIRQRARFRLFEQQMERRKLELIMRARRGGAAR
jgi:hypothetical protein